MAAAHDEDTDPALFHQVAHKLHHDSMQPQPPQHYNAPPGGPSHDQYDSHFAAHAQAYEWVSVLFLCIAQWTNPVLVIDPKNRTHQWTLMQLEQRQLSKL